MNEGKELNLGEQPIAKIMDDLGLEPRDLVESSDEQITFKMIGRAAKGRRLTPRVKQKITTALNRASGRSYAPGDLFTY